MNGASYMGVWAEDVDPAIKEEILSLEEAIRMARLFWILVSGSHDYMIRCFRQSTLFN